RRLSADRCLYARRHFEPRGGHGGVPAVCRLPAGHAVHQWRPARMTRASAWGGAVMLAVGVLVALGGITIHTGGAMPAPRPSVAATAAPPTPTPTPLPDPFSAPRWMVANGAVISWLAALGLLPILAIVGVALHMRQQARLIILDRPPLRDREYVTT